MRSIAPWREANGPVVYARHQKAIIGRPDSRPDLGRIAVPTLIAGRRGGPDHAAEVAREMQQAIAGSRSGGHPSRPGTWRCSSSRDLVNAALKSDWAAA